MKLQKYTIPVILIIVVAAIAWYLFVPKTTNNIDTSNIARQSAAEVAQASSIAEQNKMAVERAGLNGPYKLTTEFDGQSALDLLTKYTKVVYKKYDFGTLVESINEVTGNKQNFWAFYVNNEFASKSADKTKLKVGDTIEFVYERTEVHKGI